MKYLKKYCCEWNISFELFHWNITTQGGPTHHLTIYFSVYASIKLYTGNINRYSMHKELFQGCWGVSAAKESAAKLVQQCACLIMDLID